MKLKLPHRAAEWFLSGASVDISRVTRNLTFCSIPSKHAGSDWHPVRIGWKALARSVPDDYCTPVFLVHTRISDRSWSEHDRTVNNICDHATYDTVKCCSSSDAEQIVEEKKIKKSGKQVVIF